MATETQGMDQIIGSIENQSDPSQRVDIKYLSGQNVFVTLGIQNHFAEKEIMIPAHLVVMDLQLMGVIVSEILEKLSQAREKESTFAYAPRIEAMGKMYCLEESGGHMVLSVLETD